MKAVVRTVYGKTDVLGVREIAEPELAEGRVLVRVKAVGVNMGEWHVMTGRPTLARLFLGLRRPKNAQLGEDLAGVVEKVGPGVTRFAVGDAVFASGSGTWAELATAREDMLQAMPAGLGFEQAAVVPMSGYTALQALRGLGDLTGKHVVITGAGGGVGSYLVQLVAARGAQVTAVCSAGKADFVRNLGAHDVIDYTAADPTSGERRFEAVIDFAGGLPVRQWKRVIRSGGVLVLGGAETGGAVLGSLTRSLAAPFSRDVKVVSLMAGASGGDLAELARLLTNGELRSTLTRTYPMGGAAAAVDALRAATHPGKLALTVGE